MGCLKAFEVLRVVMEFVNFMQMLFLRMCIVDVVEPNFCINHGLSYVCLRQTNIHSVCSNPFVAIIYMGGYRDLLLLSTRYPTHC
jgi:hypothetical protein